MKQEVRVSAVQFAPEWLQREKNCERMCAFAEAEAKDGQELIVFPELVNIGYLAPLNPADPIGIEGMTNAQFAATYVREAESIPGPTTSALAKVAAKYGVYIVVGLAEKHPVIPATLYNSAALIGPEGVMGVHRKIHLPLMEKLYFFPGNDAEVFETPLGNIAIEICYDGRFPELSRIQALKGAEIICCCWARPSAYETVSPDKECFYHRSYVRAQDNGVFFISCNRSGMQGKVSFSGHSAIAAPSGTLIAKSETDQEEVIRAVFKEDDLVTYRATLTIFRDRRPDLYDMVSSPLSEPFHGRVTADHPRRIRTAAEGEDGRTARDG